MLPLSLAFPFPLRALARMGRCPAITPAGCLIDPAPGNADDEGLPGLPRAAPPLVKACIGRLARSHPGSDVVVPVLGVLTDWRAALTAPDPPPRVHLLGLVPGDRAACATALRRLAGTLTVGDPRPGPGGPTEAAVRRAAALQERGRWDSEVFDDWLLALHLDDAPAALPARPAPRPRVPILVAGPGRLFTDLYRTVEELGGRVVLDEWALEGALLARARDPAAGLAAWPAADPGARLAALAAAAARTRAAGVVLIMEAFSAALLDEPLLRATLPLPILPLEADAAGVPLDPARRLRLETFLGLLGRSR